MSNTRESRGPFYRRIFAWMGGFEDGAILRAAFFLLLAGTLSVLYVDYRELGEADLGAFAEPGGSELPVFSPVSPADTPALTTDGTSLRAPLTIALKPGRALELTGTIDPGAADRLADEIAARGEYIDVVVLNSPGGSVSDALAMGTLIRAEGYATRVAAGALCASSCPLVFAGGVEREASKTAALGVHQVYSVPQAGSLDRGIRANGVVMADAQRTTALITRHLIDLGVDAAVWLHALETPPGDLYFFAPEELLALKLATKLNEG